MAETLRDRRPASCRITCAGSTRCLADRQHVRASARLTAPPACLPAWVLQPTQWLGALHDGAPVYSIPSLDLTLRHVRGSNQGATISLCRSGGEETWGSCCAGIDWDCNGQVGSFEQTNFRQERGNKALASFPGLLILLFTHACACRRPVPY